MSQSNYITLALFAVIVLVFLIDYLKKRKENSIEKSVEKFIEKESKNKVLFFLDFILLTVIVFILYVVIVWALGTYIPAFPSYGLRMEDEFYDFIILYSWVPACLSVVLGRFIFIKKFGFFIAGKQNILRVLHSSKINSVILKRKKNIALSILLISIFKVLVHYFFYSSSRDSFGMCLDEVFTDELNLFIPLTIVFLIVVWFFSDKIKAQ